MRFPTPLRGGSVRHNVQSVPEGCGAGGHSVPAGEQQHHLPSSMRGRSQRSCCVQSVHACLKTAVFCTVDLIKSMIYKS